MLIGVFKSNQKIVNAFVIVLAFLLWLPSLWVNESQLVLDNLPFVILNKTAAFIVSFILIGLQGVYLNYIVNEFKLIKKNTFLPALFFVVLNSGASFLLEFTPIIIVNTLLLVVMHLSFLVYNKDTAFSISFNVGFLLSLASIIYFPIIIVIPLFWIVLSYLKPFNLREFVISILGFLVPVIFYVLYYFLLDRLIELVPFDYGYQVFKNDKEGLELTFFYVVIALGVFTGLNTAKTISSHVVSVRKYFLILSLLIFLLMATRFFTKDETASYVLVTVPLAVFFADFFNTIKRKWLAELLFVCLLVSIVVGYFS